MEKSQYFQDQVLNFPHLISSCSIDDIKYVKLRKIKIKISKKLPRLLKYLQIFKWETPLTSRIKNALLSLNK